MYSLALFYRNSFCSFRKPNNFACCWYGCWLLFMVVCFSLFLFEFFFIFFIKLKLGSTFILNFMLIFWILYPKQHKSLKTQRGNPLLFDAHHQCLSFLWPIFDGTYNRKNDFFRTLFFMWSTDWCWKTLFLLSLSLHENTKMASNRIEHIHRHTTSF